MVLSNAVNHRRRHGDEMYDAETETRPRRDVQNNVSRRSVETFKP